MDGVATQSTGSVSRDQFFAVLVVGLVLIVLYFGFKSSTLEADRVTQAQAARDAELHRLIDEATKAARQPQPSLQPPTVYIRPFVVQCPHCARLLTAVPPVPGQTGTNIGKAVTK